MTNTENATLEAELKKFSILWKSNVPFLIYSIGYILNYSFAFKKFDVIMSISTRDRVHFGKYLLTRKAFGHESWQTNR